MGLGACFLDWYQKPLGQKIGKKKPVILVDSEGGGERATFWTALVLAQLHDEIPDFTSHVFSISGVSRGSLGAAVFADLIASPEDECKYEIPTEVSGDNGKNLAGNLRCRAMRILREDFLAPTVSTMVFPDMFQRFLPFAFFDDRAMALEKAWESAWTTHENTHVFESPFNELWHSNYSNDARAFPPFLFLNSTVVETGQRLIVNPLGLSSGEFNRTFNDALDGIEVVGYDLPLSTAVHMSARFTYVSPAGTVRRLDNNPNPEWIHVVDGGYFENSGSVTSDEIFSEILLTLETCRNRDDLCGMNEEELNIHPVLIHISNEPMEKTLNLPKIKELGLVRSFHQSVRCSMFERDVGIKLGLSCARNL
ncbi:MAG: hypothetical protein GKS05_02595 [Nitrospirales bacterium]|nr:hypothetical protein [Nitrospirales bacterium]